MAVPARTVLENGPRIRPCPHKTKYIRSPRPEVRNVPTPTLMPPADRPESNAAHTAASRPGWGRARAWRTFSLRAMEWPFRRTTTSKHGDWARRRPTSLSFLDKLIFALFALVSMVCMGWFAYYPCQRLGA